MHNYLAYIFTATSNKKYALNSGGYKVTEVQTYGIGWSDTYSPNYHGEFEINPEIGTHPVFVVYLTNDEWYDQLYLDPELYIEAASTRFDNNYDIILFPGPELEWDPSSSLITEELLDLLLVVGGSEIGLAGDWEDLGGPSSKNHGFDVLAGFTGYRSDHYGKAGSYSDNHLVVTGGNPIARLESGAMDNIFQHELSHCYGAYDRWDWEIWDGQPSVMSYPTGLTWLNHWGYTDHDIIYNRRDQFDHL